MEKEKITIGSCLSSKEDIQLDFETKEEKGEYLVEFYQKIEELKQVFTPSEWYLIATEFGLEGYGAQSNEEVAKTFNCNRSAIVENKKVLEKKLKSSACQKIMEQFKD